MSFTMGVMAQVPDLATFTQVAASSAKETALNAGATDVRFNQVIMGGDRAGMVGAMFEVPGINAAMEVNAAMYANNDIVNMMRDTGVQVQSRTLMRHAAHKGTTDGQYSSYLMMSGDQLPDETANSNLEHGFGLMGSAVNGMRLVQAWAAGATPAPFGLISWTDDLDAFASASAATMADPTTQQNFADSNTAVQGRMVLRRLV